MHVRPTSLRWFCPSLVSLLLIACGDTDEAPSDGTMDADTDLNGDGQTNGDAGTDDETDSGADVDQDPSDVLPEPDADVADTSDASTDVVDDTDAVEQDGDGDTADADTLTPDVSADPCEACAPDAVCTPESTPVCACPEGWYGDGETCAPAVIVRDLALDPLVAYTDETMTVSFVAEHAESCELLIENVRTFRTWSAEEIAAAGGILSETWTDLETVRTEVLEVSGSVDFVVQVACRGGASASNQAMARVGTWILGTTFAVSASPELLEGPAETSICWTGPESATTCRVSWLPDGGSAARIASDLPVAGCIPYTPQTSGSYLVRCTSPDGSNRTSRGRVVVGPGPLSVLPVPQIFLGDTFDGSVQWDSWNADACVLSDGETEQTVGPSGEIPWTFTRTGGISLTCGNSTISNSVYQQGIDFFEITNLSTEVSSFSWQQTLLPFCDLQGEVDGVSFEDLDRRGNNGFVDIELGDAWLDGELRIFAELTCRGLFESDSVVIDEVYTLPTITSFTANPARLPVGATSVELCWESSGASYCELYDAYNLDDVQVVDPTGCATVNLSSPFSGEWGLNCSIGESLGALFFDFQQVYVPVGPAIDSLTASETVLAEPGFVELSWSASQADSCVLTVGSTPATVDLVGSARFFIENDTRVELRCADSEDTLPVYGYLELYVGSGLRAQYIGWQTPSSSILLWVASADLSCIPELVVGGEAVTPDDLEPTYAIWPLSPSGDTDRSWSLTCSADGVESTRVEGAVPSGIASVTVSQIGELISQVCWDAPGAEQTEFFAEGAIEGVLNGPVGSSGCYNYQTPPDSVPGVIRAYARNGELLSEAAFDLLP